MACKQALAIDPDYVAALVEISEIQLAQEQFEEAVRTLRTAIEKDTEDNRELHTKLQKVN